MRISDWNSNVCTSDLPDEAAPSSDDGLGQCNLRIGQLILPVFAIDHAHIVAVQSPLPAVKTAMKFLHLSATFGQAAATMHADVMEAFYSIRRGAHDRERVFENVECDEVADVRDLQIGRASCRDRGWQYV